MNSAEEPAKSSKRPLMFLRSDRDQLMVGIDLFGLVLVNQS
jgi:hypothetical protein